MTAILEKTLRGMTLQTVCWCSVLFFVLLGKNVTLLLLFIVCGILAMPIVALLQHLHVTNKLAITQTQDACFHQGNEGNLSINLENNSKVDIQNTLIELENIGVQNEDHETGEFHTLKPGNNQIKLKIPEDWLHRGEYFGVRVFFHTKYPFEFFSTKKTFRLQTRIIVYPEIEKNAPAWPKSKNKQMKRARAGEDVVGHREYEIGDSIRSVDWKLSARQNVLIVREYEEEKSETLLFTLDQVKALPREKGLSRLTAWILRAEQEKKRYALILDGVPVSEGIGEAHKHRCLTALARMP